MSRVKVTATISLSIILLSFNCWGRQLEPVAQPHQQEQQQRGRQLEPVTQPQRQEQQEQQQLEQVLQEQVLQEQMLQEQGQAEDIEEQVLDDKQQKPNFFQKIRAFFCGKKTTPSSGISIERHQVETKDSLQISAMDSLVSSILTSSLEEKPDSIAKVRRDSIFFYELVNGIVNDEPLIDEVLEEAYKHIGKRYVYGSPGPDTFDCSGFTSYCYRKIGIELNRSSKDQALNGFPVSRDQLRKGDIIIFGSRRNPKTIGHVGMVVEYYPETGRFKFIHAASQGVEFQWSDHSYYSIRYLGARRIVD